MKVIGWSLSLMLIMKTSKKLNLITFYNPGCFTQNPSCIFVQKVENCKK